METENLESERRKTKHNGYGNNKDWNTGMKQLNPRKEKQRNRQDENWENKTRVSKKMEKGKEKSEKQGREYWDLIIDDNTGRLEDNCNNYWNIGS